jgi:transketolase
MSENLQLFSAKIRLETCKMLAHRGFGHLGGALSIVETLSVLFGEKMNIDPKNPMWDQRDYFVLSKGHAGPSYYSTLALKGYFPTEVLYTLNENGTNLPSHPDRLKTIGVDTTTGSLGQGISLAVGIAKALKLDNKPNKVYAIVGDGECNEGQVWEAFQFAAHQKLDNLLVFIDENHKQLDGLTVDVNNPFDLRAKMEAFGFYALRVDGSQ